jgi:membrane dipeptidase
MIVDAHLDVAYNVLYNGRDLTRPLAELRATELRAAGQRDNVIAMTSLPAFAAAGVALVFASLYARPAHPWSSLPGKDLGRPMGHYTTPEEAKVQALEQLAVYEGFEEAGQVRIIRDCSGLDAHLRAFREDGTVGVLVTMEGADPIASAAELPWWFERGLRMVGLAWDSTRYAGGSGSSTALTDAGRDLLSAMAEVGVIHDAAHLSEEAFWEAVGLPHHGLCVSHGNARGLLLPPPGHRATVPLNRHLSDAQIAAVAHPRGAASRGVIGLALINDFLEPRWWFDAAGRTNLVSMRSQGAAHLHYIAALAGWESVGIGSDVDSGFGRDETPVELDSVADWRTIGDHVPTVARQGVLGGNWLRLLRETLPRS